MPNGRPIKVVVVGGGCASVTAAFELTRPQHNGRYEVTIYQVGWRLGGKGGSGRGPAGRVEEHGLHVWLGFYENAFRLLRECYAELGRDPSTSPLASWRDAFLADSYVGIADPSSLGGWLSWAVHFPPAEGLPGDPLTSHNPFTLSSYLGQLVALLRSLLFNVKTRRGAEPGGAEDQFRGSAMHSDPSNPPATFLETITEKVSDLLRFGVLATTAGLIEALAILELLLRMVSPAAETVLLRLVEGLAFNVRDRLENFITADEDVRCKWEIIDLVLAILVGAVRFRLLFDPRGLSAIDGYECREWLRINGASKRSLDSAFVRGLYDLALAYEDGDPRRPALAAGQALRGSLRMFFTYRGALFWKMRAGMGDIVFAPFYEVLRRRGVRFKFFHRLENVKLAGAESLAPGDRPYVEALEFDIQSLVNDGREYEPLVDVKGLPSWPSVPDWSQLVEGSSMQQEGWEFESHWDRRRAATTTLQVTRDFDFVVLGVSIGVIPYVCQAILFRDRRWRDMVREVKTVATQAFQIWLREDMPQLGWNESPITLSAFVKPFDTWSDTSHVVAAEDWRYEPKSIAYFCNVLPDPPVDQNWSDPSYPLARREEVRRNAINFLNHHVHHLWPKAIKRPGEFRWDLLVNPYEQEPVNCSIMADEQRFRSQYWAANVNPTDRYVLALPGSLKYRISPLDNSYDNLTIAGDWTDCGFNEGCVEAAVMSGRLAAHAIAQYPPLEEIIGYDHP